MNYLTALQQATTRLEARGVEDETEAQAGLRLACLALSSPSLPGQEWALLGSELLAALTELYPDPAPIAVAARHPSIASSPARRALIRLVLVLANGYDRASAQSELPAQRRFAYAATAARLDGAVRGLM
ncbi:hypothetical protein KIF24_24915 [Micromonospora sp. Llam7]|uniref:hypothetical protein n=1 Tax=Micromonospora tarapacensis TaxID=2835305 RepID=UPI001C838CF5|nr:hypothetical protein [Micromonospora tarapacensis]MBX7268952.1 hypothetical protein [Micromonospora tarapacensis]